MYMALATAAFSAKSCFQKPNIKTEVKWDGLAVNTLILHCPPLSYANKAVYCYDSHGKHTQNMIGTPIATLEGRLLDVHHKSCDQAVFHWHSLAILLATASCNVQCG